MGRDVAHAMAHTTTPPVALPVAHTAAVTARDVLGVRWRLRLLGAFDLDDGQQQHTHLPSRAATALLARLALQPERAQSREVLVELLWPEVEPSAGRQRLRQTLSTLRMLLQPPGAQVQPVLLADRQTIRLVPGALHCDVQDFEAACKANRHDEAVSGYGGDLLPGFYDEWISDERLRLEGLYDRAVGLSLRGPDGEPRRAWSAPATAPPAGLGLAAQPATDASTLPGLADAEPPAASPAQPAPAVLRLPSYLTRWLGADQQATRLRSEVMQQRLVTLLGPGGAGKTRMAVETARNLALAPGWPGSAVQLDAEGLTTRFDLVAFVALADCTSATHLQDRLAGSLLARGGAHNALGQVQQVLAGRHALLVLDNCEQLDDEAAQLLAGLLAALPRLHALVTSRRALELDGERLLNIATLDLPRPGLNLDECALNPAVQLFVERARAARGDFHLHAGNQAAICTLVRQLEGLPLAIELAAARVRSFSPADMTALLHSAQADGLVEPQAATQALDLLARRGARAAQDTRHASMQQVVDWSWRLLSPAQQQLMTALTVWPAGFDADLVRHLCAGWIDQALLRLDELVAQSLLRVEDASGGLRFHLYEPIRQFVLAHGSATVRAQAQAAANGALVAWFEGLPPTLPLTRVQAHNPNLWAALAACLQAGHSDAALRLMLGALRIYEYVSLPERVLLQLEAAVAGCTEPELQARGHSLLALRLYDAGRHADAMAHAQHGLDQIGGDALLRARALYTLARLRLSIHHQREGLRELLDEAEREAQRSGQARMLSMVLSAQAHVANELDGDGSAAEQLHLRVIELLRPSGDEVALNVAYYNLVVAAHSQGRNALALQRVQPVVAESRRLHDRIRLGHSLTARAAILGQLRRWAEAGPDIQEALRLAWDDLQPNEIEFRTMTCAVWLAHCRRSAAAAQLGAWCEQTWRTRSGHIIAPHQRELKRLRRLLKWQLAPAQLSRQQAIGRSLSLSQAVALALQPSD